MHQLGWGLIPAISEVGLHVQEKHGKSRKLGGGAHKDAFIFSTPFPELLKLISLFVTRRWLQMRRYQTRATRYIKNYQSTETLRHQPHSLPTLFDDNSQSQRYFLVETVLQNGCQVVCLR